MPALENLIKNLCLKELQRLSAQLGLNVGGNKTTLRAQILSLSLLTPPPQQQQQDSRGKRVLSIDMGIRNMAYCVLDLPAGARQRPIVRHWSRLAVPLYGTRLPAERSSEETTATATGAGAEAEAPASATVPLPQFAAAAYALAHSLLSTHTPNHVLIEAQRWRSAGSHGVLQWTIRVNTLEAMLHAVLYALRLQGHGPDGWTCESVDPGRVTRVWTVAEAGGGGRVKPSVVKTFKKRVVRQWLRERDVVDLADDRSGGGGGGSVLDAQELMLLSDGRCRAVKRNGQPLTAADRKVDDLADCLMQAVTWLRWQQNRRSLLEGRLPGP